MSTSISTSVPKFKIYPEGEGFAPNPTGVSHYITKIIQSKFDEPWPTWKKVPVGVRDMWFGEFKKRYCWLPEHEHQVRINFETRCRIRLKNMFSEARNKPDVRPRWLSSNVWDGLLRYWESDEFKALSVQAKKNRASEDGVGSSLHTGGSIPMSEHKRRLQAQTGGEVTAVQLFMHTHLKKDKSWVDNKSSQAYEKFITKWNEIQSNQNSNDCESDGERLHAPMLSETDIWINENVTKRGRVYGLGSEGAKYKCMPSTSQTIQWASSVDSLEFQELISKMQEQLNKERQEKEELARRLAILEEEKLVKDEAMIRMKRRHDEAMAKMMEQNIKVEQKMNKRLKEMMNMLKSSSKCGLCSQTSFVLRCGDDDDESLTESD